MPAPPPLDLDAIAGALEPYADLQPVAPLSVLEGGFGSVALETAGGLVVLVARDRRRPARYAMVARLLPRLRGRLGLAVPEPVRYTPPSAAPHAMLVYAKLPGEPLRPDDVTDDNRDRLAGSIGACLARLHALPLDEVRVAGLPEPEPLLEEVPARVERLLPDLHRLLTAAECGRIRAWVGAFRSDERVRNGYRPALRHGDAWFGNFLVDDAGAVSGLIDWEDAAIGDPAQDLAQQLYLGRPFLDAVLDAYREHGGAYDEATEHRSRRWWESAEFSGLEWSLRHGDEVELAEAIGKLRANPILAGW